MIKNLIDKLNQVLKFSTELEFTSANVVGTDSKIEYSNLEIGASVFQSSGEGSVEASNGVYKLDNGVEINVEDGKISEIISEGIVEEVVDLEDKDDKEKVDEVVEESTKTDPKPAVVEPIVEEVKPDEVEALKELISALQKELKEIESNSPTKEDLEKFKSDLIKELKSIPVQFSKTDNRVEIVDENEKYSAIARSFTKK